MKTSDEIKKGLERCMTLAGCADCPYRGEKCALTVSADTLAYIQQLEAQNAELVRKADELERVTRERDAAVEDLRGRCFACVHVKPHDKFPNLNACQFISFVVGGQGKRACEHWQWRGVREDA